MDFSGFAGNNELMTSVENMELVEKGRAFKRFVFLNSTNCQVKINNSEPIFLLSGQGVITDALDAPVKSFVIVTPNVNFCWIGTYTHGRIS